RIGEMGEALFDHLSGPIRAIETVVEHELESARLRLGEDGPGDDAAVPCDAESLEHVERRVERAVAYRLDARAAVPTAVSERRRQHGLRERAEPLVVGNEVRADPEPETEVAKVHALEQASGIDLDRLRHEPVELLLCVRSAGWVVLRQAARHEEEKRPYRVGPTPFRPAAVGALSTDHVCHPAVLDGAAPFFLPYASGLVEEIAHDLPANDGVSLEQPLDDRILVRGVHATSLSEVGRTTKRSAPENCLSVDAGPVRASSRGSSAPAGLGLVCSKAETPWGSPPSSRSSRRAGRRVGYSRRHSHLSCRWWVASL